MRETLNGHNSQCREQNGLIKMDVVHVGIRNDSGKGRYISPELRDYNVVVLTATDT